MDVDLSVITGRLDSMAGVLSGIREEQRTLLTKLDTDINSWLYALDSDLLQGMGAGFDSMAEWLNLLYVRLGRIYDAIQSLDGSGGGGGTVDVDMSETNGLLSDILADMQNLDRSTADLVDLAILGGQLTTLNETTSTILEALQGWPEYPEAGTVDLGAVERYLQSIDARLSAWPEYPEAPTYAPADLTTIESYLQSVLHSLNDLQDADSGVPLLRGYLMTLDQNVRAILDALGDWPDYPEAGTVDLGAVERYLQSIDSRLAVWPDYPDAGAVSVDFSDLLDELSEFHNDFVTFWAGVNSRLDEIIARIGNDVVSDPGIHLPKVPDDTAIIGPIEVDINGYPVMPDWVFWEQRPEIDALKEAVDELMTKFPFSTLSQLAQLWAYLRAPAVAPQFDLPMPNPSDWSDPYPVHVDLSVFDTPVAVLRMGIVLWVTVRLTKRSVAQWTRDEYAGGDE